MRTRQAVLTIREENQRHGGPYTKRESIRVRGHQNVDCGYFTTEGADLIQVPPPIPSVKTGCVKVGDFFVYKHLVREDETELLVWVLSGISSGVPQWRQAQDGDARIFGGKKFVLALDYGRPEWIRPRTRPNRRLRDSKTPASSPRKKA